MGIQEFAVFVFVFGASIVVTTAFIADLIWKKSFVNRYVKWSLISVFSVYQIGFWRAIENFDGAFGNSTSPSWYEVGFIVLLSVWLVSKLVSAYRARIRRQ